jgi:integrase
MFLRFLIAEDRCGADLLGAIPTLAHWRLASLPRYLPAEDVERLIGSCKLSPVGARDRAILLWLARLGLRTGDIVQMRLQDINWKGAWIQVKEICAELHKFLFAKWKLLEGGDIEVQ